MKIKKCSRFLSLILRHKPEVIGVTLNSAGWVSVVDLLKACEKSNKTITIEQLKIVVESNDKQRFSFNDDMTMIRANQGHSVKVDLGYKECKPPDLLWHGTVGKFMKDICKDGLKKMKRHHVHLSTDWDTAQNVGDRRGNGIVLVVNSAKMYQDGHKFYLSDSGVWLTDYVPVEYFTSELEMAR